MEMNVHYFIPLFLVLTRFALIGQIFIAPISPSAVSLQITPGPSLSPFPIRAAFYYPWFPESWSQSGIYPFTKYYPLHGYYSSDDPKIIANQIAAMQYGKIQVGIASWWGQGHSTDMRIPLLLKTAEGTKFQWSLYLESEGYDNPSILSIRSDLNYIHEHYAGSPDYLHINQKFVVFVYGGDNETCDMVKRWSEANDSGAYLVLKIFPGYQDCHQQPDAWHQYSPALSEKQVGNSSFSISPGFAKAGDKSIRLERNLDRWNKNIQNMVVSQTDFQLITTFNEWGEGTAVENAVDWNSRSGYGGYLDALHWDGMLPPLPTNTPGNHIVSAYPDIPVYLKQ